jgi:hypothetical protein
MKKIYVDLVQLLRSLLSWSTMLRATSWIQKAHAKRYLAMTSTDSMAEFTTFLTKYYL